MTLGIRQKVKSVIRKVYVVCVRVFSVHSRNIHCTVYSVCFFQNISVCAPLRIYTARVYGIVFRKKKFYPPCSRCFNYIGIRKRSKNLNFAVGSREKLRAVYCNNCVMCSCSEKLPVFSVCGFIEFSAYCGNEHAFAFPVNEALM